MMAVQSQHREGRRVLNLGITGYGRLAREYYVPALARMKDVRITAVADPLKQSQLAASRQVPWARLFLNHPEMLSHETLDAVLIASPPSSHLAAWLEAREKGVAAFVEKPFALASQMEDLPRLSDAEAGLMVNFNRRFWPPYQRMIEAARDGTIGSLRDIHFTLHTNVARWSTVTQHRLSPGEGGVLHDLGSQAVDLLCQIANCEPRQISARFESKRWEADHVHLELEFPGDIHAHCELAYIDQNREALVVTGSAASIQLREANMLPHVTRSGHLSAAARLADYAWLGYRFLFPEQRLLRYTITQALGVFVESLRCGRPFQPGYAEARANLRLLALASGVAGVTITSGGANG
jgi:predicted dehydrogenase